MVLVKSLNHAYKVSDHLEEFSAFAPLLLKKIIKKADRQNDITPVHRIYKNSPPSLPPSPLPSPPPHSFLVAISHLAQAKK